MPTTSIPGPTGAGNEEVVRGFLKIETLPAPEKFAVRRTTRILVTVVVMAVVVVTIAPTTWDEAKRKVREAYSVVEDAIGLPAASFLVDGVGVVRDAFAGQVVAAALTGSARVIDGDTLEIRGVRVRLHGIDAPENAQRCRSGGQRWSCGLEATRALSRLIGSRQVACKERVRDRYGRVVAVCRVGGEEGIISIT